MESNTGWMDMGRKAGVIVLAALFVIVSYLVYHAGRFKGITDVNAMDCGQVAANIAEGRGYTTRLIRPMSLAIHPSVDRHPELAIAPVHPTIASFFMRWMPDKGRALALSCGLAFLLTAPVVFFLAWQLFDLRTAILGMALFLTNGAQLQQSISGTETSWVTLWATILFLVCYGLSRKLRWRYPLAAVAGVLMGLAYLTNYVWLVVLPLIAVYVFVSSDRATRWQATGIFLGVFVLVILPWCVRNAAVTGHPFLTFRSAEVIMATRSNPGNTLYRQFTDEYPSAIWYALDRPFELVEKVRNGLMRQYLSLTSIAGWYVTPFFLVSIMVILGARSFERVRYLWYAMFVVVMFALALTMPAERLLLPLGPFAVVVAAGFFLRLLDTRVDDLVPRARMRWMTLAVALLVGLHAMPLVLDMVRVREPTQEERTIARMYQSVREVAGITDGAIITDVPWLIAWYAERPAVWLPKTRADLRNMEDKIGKVKWLLLTPQVADANYDLAERTVSEWGPAWREGLAGDWDFEGYSVYKRVPGTGWVTFIANPLAARDLPPEVMERYEGAPEGEQPADQPAPEPAP